MSNVAIDANNIWLLCCFLGSLGQIADMKRFGFARTGHWAFVDPGGVLLLAAVGVVGLVCQSVVMSIALVVVFLFRRQGRRPLPPLRGHCQPL